MRKPSGCCRVLLLLIPPLFLLLPIGVITFALERITNALILAQTRGNGPPGGYDTPFYGLSYNQSPTIAILGICVLVYIVGTLDVFGIWELRKVEGTSRHQRVWAWIMLISNVVMAGASAGVMGYASSVQSSEVEPRRYEDLTRNDAAFTRETIACGISNFDPDQGWATTACGTAKATRFLLVPMAITSALVLVSLWILVRDRGGLRWLFGGKGRYAGFANVYELRPTSPGAPPIQPQPQWGPYSQWQPQPAQRRPQQSYQQWPQQSVPQQPAN